MKLNRKHLIGLILSIGFNVNIWAQLCLFEGTLVEVEGQQTASIFTEDTDIFYDNELLIDDQLMAINQTEEYSFNSMNELEALLDCKFYVGSDFNDAISGVLLSLDLNNELNENGIYKLDYVKFEDYQRPFEFVMINKEYLYEFVNTQRYIFREALYYEASEDSEAIVTIVTPDQISGSLEITHPAEYETVTEQVFVQGSYDSLSIVPAEFGTVYNVIYNEVSSCPNAEFETIEETILIKEAHVELEKVPEQFKFVTEAVVESFPYTGADYYERELTNFDTLQEIYSVSLELESVNFDCDNLNFLLCSEYDEISDSLFSVSGLGLAYPGCKEGYTSAGVFCYSDSIDIPYKYTTRTYTVLDIPATTKATEVPAEYTTINLQRVSNKNEIDSGCVTLEYDSIAVTKLNIPSQSVYTNIPATYTTVGWQILQSPAEFEVIPSEEVVDTFSLIRENGIEKKTEFLSIPVYDISCLHNSIKSKLVEEGVINQDVAVKSLVYYQGIIIYQVNNQLPIGAIDRALLEHLNIFVY